MNTGSFAKRVATNNYQKLSNWSFFWVILLLCIYQGQIQYFQVKGFSLAKIIIASMMFVSFCLLLNISWNRIKHRTTFSYFFVFYYVIYLLYSLFCVLRSFQPDVQVIVNLFGNYTTGMGLLVPIIAIAGDKVIYHDILLRTGIKLLVVGIVLTPLGFISGRLALFASPFVQISYLLLPFWMYLNKSQRKVLIVGLISCLLVGLFTDVRSVILREFLLIGCFLVFHIFRQKSVLTIISIIIFAVFSIAITIYAKDIILLYSQREINFMGITIDNDQNRDWMYDEVYGDLKKGDDLIFGRGALGKYFSDFFYSVYQGSGDSADSYNRYNIEVGFLSYLLKGGFILLWSTIILLLSASLLAFFKSNNAYVKGLGIVILCHIIVMVVENFPKLTTYDVIIWFYVGACLSYTIRASTNPLMGVSRDAIIKNNTNNTKNLEFEVVV